MRHQFFGTPAEANQVCVHEKILFRYLRVEHGRSAASQAGLRLSGREMKKRHHINVVWGAYIENLNVLQKAPIQPLKPCVTPNPCKAAR